MRWKADIGGRIRPRRPGLVALIFLAVSAVSSPAFSHKFGGPNDPCERRLGASMLHITLFQPQFDPDAEYCDEVPRAGNTVFVLDTIGDDLRRVPIGVTVDAIASDGSRRTVLEVPPAVYRRGVVDTQLELADGMRYEARVSIGQSEGQKATEYSFPIRVRAWYRAFVMPLMLILGVAALVAISVLRYRRFGAIAGDRRRHAAAVLLACSLFAVGIALSSCRAAKAPGALPDVRLIDSHGRRVALSSLKGKVVLLNFVHIGCPGVCDNLTNKFGQIADALGPELGSRVVLVTVTNDPEHDGPEELLKLARGMQADMSGWLFLTGDAADVARVIDAFGVDNRPLPDGSPNHITRVFMLGPDLRQRREYAGMAMDTRVVAAEIRNQMDGGGA